MLSSKSDEKAEGRFAGRLDVLSERVDTLASTVATTASAIAKKDGEIASLRRELELRDQQLQALAAHTAQGAGPSDPQELHKLRQAVAALQAERATQGGTKQVDELTAKMALLSQRLETLSSMVSTTAGGLAGRDGEIAAIRKYLETARVATQSAPAVNPDLERQVRELGAGGVSTRARLDGQAEEIEAIKAQLTDPHAHADELRAMLTTLRSRVEALDGLRAGVTEEQLDERLTETTAALAGNAQKVEALGRQVTESSARLESIAEELHATKPGVTEEQLDERLAETRAALAALPERIDELASRVHSGTTRLADAEQKLRALDREATESSSRVESMFDERLAETSAALAALGTRIDELASGVDSATTSHADEEQRLETLHHQVSESSSRIESIADDLREALGAFPDAAPDQLGELSTRIDTVEKRVATVAAEVARAKTLWPVALRSLEARLDDVAPKRAHDDRPAGADGAHDEDAREDDEPEETPDDLLAGLRDSLHAMESVAAELERTTEPTPEDAPEEPTPHQAVVGGARVVPLRTTDP